MHHFNLIAYKLVKFANLLETISKQPIIKTASTRSAEEIFAYAKKFSVQMCPSKYIGTENKRLNLKTASETKIGSLVQELHASYEKFGTESSEGIKITDCFSLQEGFQINVINKVGHNLSFQIFPMGNQYEMNPIDPNWKKILWKSRVSSAGHVANVLSRWSQELRVADFENLTIKTASYKSSPLLEEVKHQQDFSDFVEVSADQIFPQDPKWIIQANLSNLKSALKKIYTIKKAAVNHESTQKWANDWILRIKNEIQKKVKQAHVSKKNLIKQKIEELKLLIGGFKKSI